MVGCPQLQQDLNERRLARPRRADNADRLAADHLEVDVTQHRPAGAVGVGDILEGEGAHRRQRPAIGVGTARHISAPRLLQAIDEGQGLARDLV